MSNRSRRNRARRAPGQSLVHPEGAEHAERVSHRQARLEHILLNELQSLIRDAAGDPTLDPVRLLAVELSRDAAHARVVYGVASTDLQQQQALEQRTRAGLVRASGFLRSGLARQLNLKKVPKLSFAFVGLLSAEASTGAGGESCPE